MGGAGGSGDVYSKMLFGAGAEGESAEGGSVLHGSMRRTME